MCLRGPLGSWSLAAIALLTFVGCGTRVQIVKGKVAFEDGGSVTDGDVQFHLDEETVYSAEIQDDGSFELTDAPAGSYQVVVHSNNEQPSNSVHYRYAYLDSTPLRVQIVDGENTGLTIRVQRGVAEKTVMEDEDPDKN